MQNDLITLGLAIVVVGFITYVSSRIDESLAKRYLDPNMEPVEACPPHSWQTMAQPGMPGVEYIRCRRCNFLPGITHEDNL